MKIMIFSSCYDEYANSEVKCDQPDQPWFTPINLKNTNMIDVSLLY